MGNPIQAQPHRWCARSPKIPMTPEELQFNAKVLKQAHEDLKRSGINPTTKNILERIPNVECLENTGKQAIEHTSKVQKLLQKIVKFVTKIK